MPRQVDYPRASLLSSLELADAVNAFGGSCMLELAAEKLHRKIGGAFKAIVGAAVKYGLITHKVGKLSVTPLYRSLKLAYTEQERTQFLRQAFLSAPLFREIEARFAGERVPVEHFEKMLVREFQVPDDIASRVTGYFFEGAKQANLIDQDGKLISNTAGKVEDELSEVDDDLLIQHGEAGVVAMRSEPFHSEPLLPNSLVKFTVRVSGPGLDSTVLIGEPEDLLIVQALLKKVERAILKPLVNGDTE